MVRELVGAHFGLGASLQDIQKLPAETFQLGKANPVEGDEHQLGAVKGRERGRRRGSGGTWPPGTRRQVHLGHDVEAGMQIRGATQEGKVPALSLSSHPKATKSRKGGTRVLRKRVKGLKETYEH